MSSTLYRNHIRVLLFVLLMGFFSVSGRAQDRAAAIAATNGAHEKGQTLFKSNCASCHKINEKLVGPPLAGIEKKYEKEWIYKWVRNSQEMVKSGDAQAVAIFNEYNKSVMTAFPTLKNEDVDAILSYVSVEAQFPATATPAAGAAGTGAAATETAAPYGIFMVLLAILLAIIAWLLGRVVRTAANLGRVKRGEPELAATTFESFFNQRWVRVVAGLLVFALFSYTTYDNARGLGRQKNYQPEQPIKFSHALHAGKWKVECQYCHSGAGKGKSAVIPSPSVCMNCHKAIDKGPVYGETEINKIYAAVGWDKTKHQYIENYEQKPIEWVRIHNLPDHVYFNHSQHVTAGKIACQKCHGEIEKMEVVKQENTLGMGWCVSCHRETEVQFTGNAYYNAYEKYHKALKEGKMEKVTVEDIGGLECQKCHY